LTKAPNLVMFTTLPRYAAPISAIGGSRMSSMRRRASSTCEPSFDPIVTVPTTPSSVTEMSAPVSSVIALMTFPLGPITSPIFRRRRHPQQEAKLRQIEQFNLEGVERIGALSDGEFFAAGVALYAGEGAKTDGTVQFSNTDPTMIAFFCGWLRHFFDVDESRLRARVYLHQGLDLEAAEAFWSDLTGIPRDQFRQAYRAVSRQGIRHNKHEMGCAYVYYCCSKTHREITGLMRALLSSNSYSGVVQSAEQRPVKPFVAGSSPAPGAQTPPSRRTIFPIDEKSSRP
jgi:hypothetical protein